MLISTDGWKHPELPLPVTAPDTVPMTLDVLDDDGNHTTLTLDPAVKFGSLQSFYDGKRSVLVATSNGGAVGQLDELLRWLGADVQRWSALDGIALLSVPDRDPVIVSGGLGSSTPDSGSAERDSPQWWWWVGGGLAVAVAVVAIGLLLRSPRKPSSE